MAANTFGETKQRSKTSDIQKFSSSSGTRTLLSSVYNRYKHKQVKNSKIQIALTGATAEKRAVGEWFGPNTMAQVLKRITKSRSLGFGVAVAMDSVVSIEDVSAQIVNQGNPTPLVLIIPLRLGLNNVNEIYVNPLKVFLASKYCVGIMGGKPNQVEDS